MFAVNVLKWNEIKQYIAEKWRRAFVLAFNKGIQRSESYLSSTKSL